MKKLWSVVLRTLFLIAFLPTAVSAQERTYKRIHLQHNVSVEVPRHWTALTAAERGNVAAAGTAMVSNAGIEASDEKTDLLLHVIAEPRPTGAQMRISVAVPPVYTQSELAAASQADLKEVTVETLKVLQKLEASGSGLKIIEMLPARIERVGGLNALVTSYRRVGVNESVPWHVTQYKIPAGSREILMTLSYRERDGIMWRPILERVKKSIRF